MGERKRNLVKTPGLWIGVTIVVCVLLEIVLMTACIGKRSEENKGSSDVPWAEERQSGTAAVDALYDALSDYTFHVTGQENEMRAANHGCHWSPEIG